jgi:hypothetical protein
MPGAALAQPVLGIFYPMLGSQPPTLVASIWFSLNPWMHPDNVVASTPFFNFTSGYNHMGWLQPMSGHGHTQMEPNKPMDTPMR